jgi:hypothetical protein
MRIRECIFAGAACVALAAPAACSSSSGGGRGPESTSGSDAGGSGSASGSGSTTGSGSTSGSVSSGSSGSDAATGGQGSASVSGSFAGATFTPLDAIAGPAVDAASGTFTLTAKGYATPVFISSLASACSAVAAATTNGTLHQPRAGTQGFLIDLLSDGALAPGAYPILHFGADAGTPTSGSIVSYDSYGPTCNALDQEEAVSGAVTITNAGASEVVGTFDIMMEPVATGSTSGTAHEVTGSFTAPVCPALVQSAMSSAGNEDAGCY